MLPAHYSPSIVEEKEEKGINIRKDAWTKVVVSCFVYSVLWDRCNVCMYVPVQSYCAYGIVLCCAACCLVFLDRRSVFCPPKSTSQERAALVSSILILSVCVYVCVRWSNFNQIVQILDSHTSYRLSGRIILHFLMTKSSNYLLQCPRDTHSIMVMNKLSQKSSCPIAKRPHSISGKFLVWWIPHLIGSDGTLPPGNRGSI